MISIENNAAKAENTVVKVNVLIDRTTGIVSATLAFIFGLIYLWFVHVESVHVVLNRERVLRAENAQLKRTIAQKDERIGGLVFAHKAEMRQLRDRYDGVIAEWKQHSDSIAKERDVVVKDRNRYRHLYLRSCKSQIDKRCCDLFR